MAGQQEEKGHKGRGQGLWWRLLLIVLLLVGAFASMMRLKFREDILEMLPKDDPVIADYQGTLRRFRVMRRMLFDVHMAADGVSAADKKHAGVAGARVSSKGKQRQVDPQRLTAYADHLAGLMRRSGLFARVTYRIGQKEILELQAYLWKERAALWTKAERQRFAKGMRPGAVDRAVAKVLEQLTMPSGLMLKRRLLQDPMGWGQALLQKLRFLGSGLRIRPYRGYWLSQDHRHLLMVAEPKLATSKTGSLGDFLARVRALHRKASDKFPDVRATFIGGHRSTHDNSVKIKRDVALTVSVSLLAILLLFLLVFRRPMLLFLTSLPPVFGAAIAIGLMGLWHSEMSAIPLAFGAILLGIAVDYAIHLCYHFEHHEGPVSALVRRLAPILILAALTSMAAFSCLLFARFRGQHAVGLFSSLGIGAALFFTLFLLPPLLARLGPAKRRAFVDMQRAAGALSRWRDRHGRLILLVVLGVTVFACFGISWVGFEGDMERLHALSAQTQAREAQFRRTWGDPRAMISIVVRGKTLEEALQQNDRLFVRLQALRRQGEIKWAASIAPLWPSRKTRAARRARWRAFWSPSRLQNLRRHLKQAAEKRGFRPEAFHSFWRALYQSIGTNPASIHQPSLQQKTPTTPPRKGTTHPATRASVTRPAAKAVHPRAKVSATRPASTTLPATKASTRSPKGMRDERGTKEVVGVGSGRQAREDARIRAFFLRERVRREGGYVYILTLTRAREIAPAALMKGLRKEFTGVSILSGRDFVKHVMKVVERDFRVIAWVALLVVLVVVFFGFLHLDLVLAALVPLLLSMLWTVGLMGWLGISFNVLNVVVSIFIFGLGVDFSIFFVRQTIFDWHFGGRELDIAVGSVCISALTTLFGMGSLVLALHPLLFSIGVTAVLGISCTLLTTLFVTPLLARFVVRTGKISSPMSLKVFIGSILGLGWFFGWLLFLLPFLPILWLLRRSSPRVSSWVRGYMHVLCKALVFGFPFGFRRFLDQDKEHHGEPAIIIANHQSMFDIPILLSLPYEMRMVVKRWVWNAPVMGAMVKLAEMLDVPSRDDHESPTYVLELSKEALAQGHAVMIFPEGTRSKDGQIRRFRSGAFQLAAQTGADLLPVALFNTRSCIQRGTYRVRSFALMREVGPRITKETFADYDDPRALRDHARARIEAMVEELSWKFRREQPALARLQVHRHFAYLGPYIEQYTYWKLRIDPFASFIESHIPEAGSILDLGCGYGLLAHYLHHYAPARHILGVDYDARKIEAAQASASQLDALRFEEGDLLTWKASSQADVVLLIDVLHYWSPTQQDIILRTAADAVREGGRLILRDTDASTGRGRINGLTERFSTFFGANQAPGQIQFRPFDELTAQLETWGFSVERLEDPMSPITGNVTLIAHNTPTPWAE